MEKKMSLGIKKISVIGLGYIGLPTAAMFALHKVKVVGVDIAKKAVESINQGKIHIVEPELDEIVRSTVSAGYLKASLIPEAADAFLIAVPTPFKDENHEPDLDYIESATKSIAPYIQKGNLIILESTSPVGTTELMAGWLSKLRPDLTFPQDNGENSDIRIAYCPERVLPGKIVKELISNDRVIGGMTPLCAEQASVLYKIFVQGNCIVTNARTAEMCKLTENSFRDVNIAFANELSIICDKLNIDPWELIKLANLHPRVNILQPGPGVGGHCIAVDPWFIVSKNREEARLIKAARLVNDSKPQWVIEKIKEMVNSFKKSETTSASRTVNIACYGLAFKPDIDDLRESPAAYIALELHKDSIGHVLAVEPNIDELPAKLQGVELVTFEEAQRKADVHVLLVEHEQFKQKKIDSKFIVDTKGLWI
jgi:UDP-N-acetyl-D-mannosaminuronic acid dehydrogenase